MHKGGTFPNRDNLTRVYAGLNKQQLADVIGYPHFSEGVWGVREWNYVFNFVEPAQNNRVVTCQFKILFDDAKLAQSFYWSPESCAKYQQPELQPKATSVAKQTPPATQHFNLSADALFAFDSSSLRDITSADRTELNQMIQEMKQGNLHGTSILVRGYTDRLGSDAYNMRLSQERADTIKGFMAGHGIDPASIRTEGMGKQNPVIDCAEADRGELIACLAPNRRVEIAVTSTETMR